MRKFSFSHAKGMQSFDFISTFKSLEELSVGYTTKLVKLPQVANPKKIKSLALINTPKFNDMEGILQYENLEKFVMNEHTVIPFEEITKLEKLKKLKKVYLNFKKESDHRLFEELVHRNGWINNNL
jgi:hypothetical protein